MTSPATPETEGLNQPPSKRRWLPIFVVVLLGVAATVVVSLMRGFAVVSTGERELLTAFSERRLIEPRLSGGFKCGAFDSPDDRSGIEEKALDRATDLLTDAAAQGGADHEVAYARLLISKSERLPEAAGYLRRVLAVEPKRAEAHNDLAVCLIQQNRIEDALEELDSALTIQAEMPEALFNRALCYQRLLLRDAAADAFAHFVEVEKDVGWANEARRRMQNVSAPLESHKVQTEIEAAFDRAFDGGNLEEAASIAERELQGLIKYASERLPRHYLKEVADGRPEEGARALSKIEWIGERLVEAKGDSSVAELGRYFRNLPESERRAEMALISAYAAALSQSYKSYTAVQESFERLRRDFARRGNLAFEYFSIHFLASIYYSEGRLKAAETASKEALDLAVRQAWPYRQAQELIQRGIFYSRLGQDSLAIKTIERARALVHGMPIEAYALQYVSDAYGNLGDVDKGLSCLRESTRQFLDRMPTLREVASNYLNIADLYRRRGNHALALLYARQSLKLSELSNDNNRAAQASAFIAVEHARLNQVDRAEAELNRAFDYVSRIDQKERSYTESVVLTQGAEMARTIGDAPRALGLYASAEGVIERGEGKEIPLLELLRGRARTYVEARDFAKARADLERAVKLLEGYRTKIVERENRSRFLDARQGVFDELVALNVDFLGRRDQAFDFLEESRARTLLDDSAPLNGPGSNRAARPLGLRDVQAGLPDGLHLVSYSVTDEGTYIFTVTGSRLDVEKSAARTEIIDRLVQDYVSGIRSRASLEELAPKAKQLYEYLIAPIAGKLADGQRLCIVPDKSLHFLPFAALIDRSGQFLVRRFDFTYAPSATVLKQCIAERRRKGTDGNQSVLAVGNPRFDRDRFPTLETLTDAEREAVETAKLYDAGSVVLTSDEATKGRVRALLSRFDVVHFAVHVLVDEKSPWLAALVLAGDSSQHAVEVGEPVDDSLLYLNEIYGIQLPRTRLVVLSACQSALGQYYRGEGIVSLVRPFLALRVPMVVASLWSIDSQATAPLMIAFHKNRAMGGKHVGEALREAQLKLAEDERFKHPFFWAPFIAVGSDD